MLVETQEAKDAMVGADSIEGHALRGRPPAEDVVQRLRSLIARRATDRRASMSPSEKVHEDDAARVIGPWNGDLKVGWTARGAVKHLWTLGMRIPVDAAPGDAIGAAYAFLREHGGMFGVTNADSALEVMDTSPIENGKATLVRFRQLVRGLPVFGSNLLLRVGPEADIERVAGHLVPDEAIPEREAALTPDRGVTEDATSPELGYWDPEIFGAATGPVQLAWRIHRLVGPQEQDVFLAADNGAEIHRHSLLDHDEHKETFDCGTCTSYTQLPGTLHYDDQCDNTCPVGAGCSPNPPCQTASPPAIVANLKTYTDNVYDYYYLQHGRESWDNDKCKPSNPKCNDVVYHRMRASTAGQNGDFGSECNAAWQSSRKAPWFQTTYNGPVRDTVAHEFTHGIDYIEGDLGLGSQGSQLNESVPDVFAEFIQREVTGSTDWEHNTGTTGCWRDTNYADTSLGGPPCPLNPTYPPDHWSFYVPLITGVCTRSNYSGAIIGKIGYLMGRDVAAGSVTHWGLPVTGIGHIKAGKVWYKALTQGAWATQSFSEYATSLIEDGCLTETTGTDLTNCFLSVAASGIWGQDTLETWSVNVEPALAYFPVSGQQRRWLFYKSPIATNLLYTYLDCSIADPNPSCTWSTPVQMDTTITSAPRATTYDYYTWVCFRNTSGAVECDRINVFGGISNGPDPSGATLDNAPTLVRNNGALFLAYKRGSGVFWRKYTTASGWGAEIDTGITTATSVPVLASADEDRHNGGTNLWILYQTTNARIGYRLFDHSTQTWGTEQLVGRTGETPTSDTRVGAVVYRGRLHVTARTSAGDIYYASCGGTCAGNSNDWTRWVKQDGTTSIVPFMDANAANDGYLYLWHNLATSDTLNWRAKLSE